MAVSIKERRLKQVASGNSSDRLSFLSVTDDQEHHESCPSASPPFMRSSPYVTNCIDARIFKSAVRADSNDPLVLWRSDFSVAAIRPIRRVAASLILVFPTFSCSFYFLRFLYFPHLSSPRPFHASRLSLISGASQISGPVLALSPPFHNNDALM